MDSQNWGGGRTPFQDQTNTLGGGGHNASNSRPQGVDAIQCRRERDRERFAAMTIEQRNEKNKKRRELTIEQRNEKNKKRRESYHRKKGKPSISDTSNGGQIEVPKENIDPTDHGDWLHRNNSYQIQSIHNDNMTGQLSKLSPKLILPAPTQTEDVETSNRSPGVLRHKRHVPSGERQSLLARRNQQFEETIARNLAAPTEDSDSAAPTEDSESIAKGESVATCLGLSPTIAAVESECMVAEGDNGTQPWMQSEVINNEDDVEDEGYLFAEQDEETDDDIEIDGAKDDFVTTPDAPDPYDKVYSNIPKETHMLKPVADCKHCSAKKFEYEPPRFCCRSGKIDLSSHDTPLELRRLWDSADADARHFRDNIRFLNGHFSFTSLYCCLDNMTTNIRDCGIYTFRAHGIMYHNIWSFGKEAGAERKHLELYFYDDDPSLEHCIVGAVKNSLKRTNVSSND
ncbi:hypothetical protein U9M48_016306 [Paspalum notatum var. saurae]|uniref:Uncharacterized protein n=1 Tax=Paspalum notatum var. saurae TaxID=547442 RepID=A0AAQ3T716_PASNO